MWVTGTGAFLLVAAAVVFVAVRWDQLPDALKLALLGAASGSALLAGRRLRTTLPATGSVLYHLGAFLLPVCAAALGVHLGAGWPELLLIEGVGGALAFTALDRVERSVVLRWAATGAVVVAAAGVGATTPVPAALALALAALGASLAPAVAGRTAAARGGATPEGTATRAGWSGAAVTWAAVAGLAPAVAVAAAGARGPALPHELGLAGGATGPLALASGLLAALVLVREAGRRRDLALVVPAGAAVVLGALATWLEARPGAGATWVAIGLAFLVVELAAHRWAGDPFWARPAQGLAAATEALAATTAVVALPFALFLAWPPIERLGTLGGLAPGSARPGVLAAAGLATAAWLVADLRRREADRTPAAIAVLVGSGWAPASVGLTATVVAGVALGTGSATATAVAALAVAVALVLGGRPGGHTLAPALAVVAPLQVATHPVLALALGAAGAVLVAGAAVVRAGLVDDHRGDAELPWLLAVAALAPLAAAAAVALAAQAGPAARWPGEAPGRGLLPVVGGAGAPWVVAATVAGCWVVALVLDRGATSSATAHLGVVGRAGALAAVVVGAPVAGPGATAALAAGVVAGAGIDAARRREPVVAHVAGGAALVGVAAAGTALGWGAGATGVALCLAGVGATAAALAAPARWRVPALTSAVGGGLVGTWLTVDDDVAFGCACLLVGAATLAGAVRWRWWPAGAVGAVVATIGVWGLLQAAGIAASDAYLAPVAATLLAAGALARTPASPDRRGWAGPGGRAVSSWVAFGPAVALLCGSALAERVAGGGGVHAVVAGAVGTVAVAVGGARRLAGPLVLGTAALVVLVGLETVTYTAGVPTWGWLATAGIVLLAAGIAMERSATGPVERGRRVVDTVRERFS